MSDDGWVIKFNDSQRDQYAGRALMGLMASNGYTCHLRGAPLELSKLAFDFADAMMAERAKRYK